MVSLYYELGVRWMLFTYNRNNALAGGCGDEDGGLTDFGREVLREMEHVGMVVCCSHIGERSAMEIMDLCVPARDLLALKSRRRLAAGAQHQRRRATRLRPDRRRDPESTGLESSSATTMPARS